MAWFTNLKSVKGIRVKAHYPYDWSWPEMTVTGTLDEDGCLEPDKIQQDETAQKFSEGSYVNEKDGCEWCCSVFPCLELNYRTEKWWPWCEAGAFVEVERIK